VSWLFGGMETEEEKLVVGRRKGGRREERRSNCGGHGNGIQNPTLPYLRRRRRSVLVFRLIQLNILTR